MEENSSISSSESSSDRSVRADPTAISEDVWETAEAVAWHEVLECIHPTLDSQEKRRDVIDYVQRLIRRSLGVEVFFSPIFSLIFALVPCVYMYLYVCVLMCL